jgi:hypothetical protein
MKGYTKRQQKAKYDPVKAKSQAMQGVGAECGNSVLSSKSCRKARMDAQITGLSCGKTGIMQLGLFQG